jgi:hypothetical protein
MSPGLNPLTAQARWMTSFAEGVTRSSSRSVFLSAVNEEVVGRDVTIE